MNKYIIIKTVKYTGGEDKQEVIFSTDWDYEAHNVLNAFKRQATWNVTYQLFVLKEESHEHST